MTRPWTIIAVTDVARSADWYMKLLGVQNTHPGATVFDQIIDADGTAPMRAT